MCKGNGGRIRTKPERKTVRSFPKNKDRPNLFPQTLGLRLTISIAGPCNSDYPKF